MVLGVIGVGSIASAIVAGLCQGGEPQDVLLSPRNPKVAASLAAAYPGVRVAESNEAVARESSTVLLCLRPRDAGLLRSLSFRTDASVISVMAGISIRALADLVGPVASIARAIPLPPVASRRGVTPIVPCIDPARSLFARLGTVVEVADESAFNLFSASSATIAAHFAYLAHIGDWLTAQGIDSLAARQYVAAMFGEIAASLQASEPNFPELAKEHATPGGINEQFSRILAEQGVWDTVHEALDQVRQRLEGR